MRFLALYVGHVCLILIMSRLISGVEVVIAETAFGLRVDGGGATGGEALRDHDEGDG